MTTETDVRHGAYVTIDVKFTYLDTKFPLAAGLGRMSMLRAVGTSLMVIAIVSFSGVFVQVVAGQLIPWQLTLTFVAGGLTGLWGGQLIGQGLSTALLQKVFSVAILGVGLFVLVSSMVSG